MSLQSLAETTKAQAAQVPAAINAVNDGTPDKRMEASNLVLNVITSATRVSTAAIQRRAFALVLTTHTLRDIAQGLILILEEMEGGVTPALMTDAKAEADSLVEVANTLAQEAMSVGGRRRKTHKGRGKKRSTRKTK